MTAQTAHKFAFGKNWQSFSDTVTNVEIDQAVAGLKRLLPEGIEGKNFLDIGSGSGLHALAALKLGASSVTAFDADADSVRTTQKMFEEKASNFNAKIEERDILAVSSSPSYEIVYSWGVLHHTGDMWKAIDNAARFVAPKGWFVLAIYKKTPLCGFWKAEKSVYSRLPSPLQFPITALFAGLYLAGIAASGRNPLKYAKEYHNYRGMDFWHDMVDWLGGYPYESATPEQIEQFMKKTGFTLQAKYNDAPSQAFGLFGSGCAEYVFKKDQ